MEEVVKMEEVVVVIVGAGPSGLATSACLNLMSIPNIILEREDCYASLWKKRAYDRLKLHLAKEFCELPHMSYPPGTPTFVPRVQFVQYLDDYVSKFNIKPKYNRSVECSIYDEHDRKWKIEVKNTASGEVEFYNAKYLVIATGENSKGFIPKIPGLEDFNGEVLHSNQYKSGLEYHGKEVLVVGCGNSGMEIAYDLSNYGAHTSIVIRSPFHVLNKEMVYMGMRLLRYLPVRFVDVVIGMFASFKYGDLTKYDIHMPIEGPFALKARTGRSPVIDVGTIQKIKQGNIKVFPAITSINNNYVAFADGEKKHFDAIVFATGYASTARNWLKDYNYILNNKGMPKNKFPSHWKGNNGLYCAGLSRRGLFGITMDAEAISNDINQLLRGEKKLD